MHYNWHLCTVTLDFAGSLKVPWNHSFELTIWECWNEKVGQKNSSGDKNCYCLTSVIFKGQKVQEDLFWTLTLENEVTSLLNCGGQLPSDAVSHRTTDLSLFMLFILCSGTVETLHYKPEGRRLDSQWDHWDFFTYTNIVHLLLYSVTLKTWGHVNMFSFSLLTAITSSGNLLAKEGWCRTISWCFNTNINYLWGRSKWGYITEACLRREPENT